MGQEKRTITLQTSDDIQYDLTANKKQSFYLQNLSPVKKKIMEIFFLNPQLAASLMNSYNKLVDKMDKVGQLSIQDMKELLDLEKQVEEAEQKLDKGYIEVFYNQCEKLLNELSPERLEMTEEGWKKLRELLQEKVGILRLQERSQIENALSGLRFYIIREKAKKNINQIDLHEEISEEEILELEVAFNFQLSQLLSNPDKKVKRTAEDIRNQAILYHGTSETNSILYDKSIWEKLTKIPMLPQDSQEIGNSHHLKETAGKSNELALVPVRTNFFQRLRERISRIGKKKSEIEKIAEEVVTEESLEEYQDLSMPPSQRYIPDRKLPVYDFLNKMTKLKSHPKGKETSFQFKDEKNMGYFCQIRVVPKEKSYSTTEGETSIAISLEDGKTMMKKRNFYFSFYENPIIIRRFANFLHLGGEFEQFLGNYYKNVSCDEYGFIDFNQNIRNEPHYKKLAVRLERAMEEYHKTQFEFYAQEEKRKMNAEQERESFVQSIKLVPGELFSPKKEIGSSVNYHLNDKEIDDK